MDIQQMVAFSVGLFWSPLASLHSQLVLTDRKLLPIERLTRSIVSTVERACPVWAVCMLKSSVPSLNPPDNVSGSSDFWELSVSKDSPHTSWEPKQFLIKSVLWQSYICICILSILTSNLSDFPRNPHSYYQDSGPCFVTWRVSPMLWVWLGVWKFPPEPGGLTGHLQIVLNACCLRISLWLSPTLSMYTRHSR